MSRRILERVVFFSAAWYLLNYASTGEEEQTPGAGLGTRGSRVRTASKQGLISFLGQHECRADFKFFVGLYSNTLSFWISGQACDFPQSNALTRQSYKKARVCWWLHIVAHSDKKCQLLTGCFCNHFCTKIQCRKNTKQTQGYMVIDHSLEKLYCPIHNYQQNQTSSLPWAQLLRVFQTVYLTCLDKVDFHIRVASLIQKLSSYQTFSLPVWRTAVVKRTW